MLAATWACQPVQAPGTSAGSVAEPPPGAIWEGDAFTFHKIRDDIYHAVGTGNLTSDATAASSSMKTTSCSSTRT